MYLALCLFLSGLIIGMEAGNALPRFFGGWAMFVGVLLLLVIWIGGTILNYKNFMASQRPKSVPIPVPVEQDGPKAP